MITLKTKLRDLVDRVKQLDLEEFCVELDRTEKFLASNPGMSVEKFMDTEMLNIFREANYSAWLNEIGDECDAEVRKKVIEHIHDPMTAFQVYLRAKVTTEEEDLLLENKFKGLLPNAEKELKDGKVQRRYIAHR